GARPCGPDPRGFPERRSQRRERDTHLLHQWDAPRRLVRLRDVARGARGCRRDRRGEMTMEDMEPQDADEGDELEAEIMRADRAFATESVGTTAEEALEGETLDQRLAEERPERPGTD